MPRTARKAPEEFVDHILARGSNKQDIFKDEEDFKQYIDILREYESKYHYKRYKVDAVIKKRGRPKKESAGKPIQ